ncbi:MAG: hypothetical protein O9313_00805 [Acetobacteraceae bacterium]|nr:hypothetical protein [Acetobacteraceae bacterium]
MEKPGKSPPKPAPSREERLAAALRENLRRRKAQARARDAAEAEPKPESPEKSNL